MSTVCSRYQPMNHCSKTVALQEWGECETWMEKPAGLVFSLCLWPSLLPSPLSLCLVSLCIYTRSTCPGASCERPICLI